MSDRLEPSDFDPWATDRLTPELVIRIPVSEEVLADAGKNLAVLADEIARTAADAARDWVLTEAKAKAIADRKDAE